MSSSRENPRHSGYQVQDPRAIRALSHPLRLQILSLLRDQRPMTVTEISHEVGESTASVSYHLSQLGRFGFVEPVPELKSGRRQPWRASDASIYFDPGQHHDPAHEIAGKSLRSALLQHIIRTVEKYNQNEQEIAQEWREAAIISDSTVYLTIAEFREVTDEILKVVNRYRSRTSNHEDKQGRYVHLMTLGIPSIQLFKAIDSGL